MKKPLATIALLALALAGCSAGPEASPEVAGSTPVNAEATQKAEQVPGKGNISSGGVDFTTLTMDDMKMTTATEFEFVSSNNAVGIISFVKNADKRVADIEKYLMDNTGYHREYMIAEVDNRKGDLAANMYQVDIFDPEGMSYTFTKARDLIEEAIPTMNSDYSYSSADGSKTLTEAEYEKIRDAGRKLEEAQAWDVSPLGKEAFILAMEIDEGALPEQIAGMSVMAHGGMDEVPAYNPLISEFKEWKAAQDLGEEWEAYKPEPGSE